MLETLLSPAPKKQHQKNFLLALWHEVNTNLERYFVIDQRQFISMDFEHHAWEEAKNFAGMHFSSDLFDYAAAIEDFNLAFRGCREFEEYYSSSIDNKTLENARILHEKKEALETKFKTIQPKITAAQKALRELLEKRS